MTTMTTTASPARSAGSAAAPMRHPRPWVYTRIDALTTLLRPDIV